jgi:hypothetical protein
MIATFLLLDEIKKEDAEKTDVSLITGKVRGSQFVESNEGDAKNHQVVEYSAGMFNW